MEVCNAVSQFSFVCRCRRSVIGMATSPSHSTIAHDRRHYRNRHGSIRSCRAQRSGDAEEPRLWNNSDAQYQCAGSLPFPELSPGSYAISVSATGFQTAQRTLALSVGQAVTANVQLEL